MDLKYLALPLLAFGVSAAAQAPPCVVPPGHDRAAMLSAIGAAGPVGSVCMEAGDYTVVTPTSTAGTTRAFAVLALGTTELRGAGAGLTTLHFVGDAGGRDWWGLSVTGAHVHHLTIETGALTGTSEQTHAIRGIGGVMPEIDHVTFEHPDRGLPGGDCIQLVGGLTAPVIGARIHNNDFAHCDRSGVAAHNGAHDLAITDSTFGDIGDQAIDAEGTGDHFDWLIARNTFATGPHAQGDLAIELQLVDRIRITDNKFWGRGIFVYSSSHVEIDHNTMVLSVAGGGAAVVEIKKASSSVDVHDNVIVRAASAGLGYSIRASPQNSGTPDHVSIHGNSIMQATSGDVINTVGIVGLNVEGNTVMYSGAPGGGFGALALGSAGVTPIRTTEIRLANNTWVGLLTGVLGISGSYAGTGTVAASGNVAIGAIKGLVCGAPANIVGPLTLALNSCPAPSGCAGVPMP